MAAMRIAPGSFILVAVVLAALAGFVDAYAFVRLGGFFVSFMSGNLTRGGASVANDLWNDARLAATLCLAFLAGVMLASVMTAAAARRIAAAMGAATLLLTGGALAAMLYPPLVLPMLAAAMGVQSGVYQREDVPPISVTFFTGNLVRMGQGLAGALMGEGARWAWLRYLVLVLGFVGGATGGAMAQARIGDHALWYAALAAAWMTLLLAVISRK